jgi:hypothetical protein
MPLAMIPLQDSDVRDTLPVSENIPMLGEKGGNEVGQEQVRLLRRQDRPY